ncbi:MAG TPA: type II toxin-antitoxin system Phd/YefM family antitoxin [Fibrobacteraceae bacterium]|nr:type II toxin-antitoxin system Phd/YefM family antitoxin [Fibrobacteraceae bacterium]
MKISIAKDIETVSNVKSRIPEVFEEAHKTSRPKIITQNGRAIGVMYDIKTYEATLKKVNLMKLIIEGEESVVNGRMISLSALRKNKGKA